MAYHNLLTLVPGNCVAQSLRPVNNLKTIERVVPPFDGKNQDFQNGKPPVVKGKPRIQVAKNSDLGNFFPALLSVGDHHNEFGEISPVVKHGVNVRSRKHDI